MFRELVVSYQSSDSPKFRRLLSILERKEIKYELKDRNMKVRRRKNSDLRSGSVVLVLIGYDGKEKYRSSRVSIAELYRIFDLIDQMPMRREELRRRG